MAQMSHEITPGRPQAICQNPINGCGLDRLEAGGGVELSHPSQIHQAKMLGFAFLHQSRHGAIRELAQTPTKSAKIASSRPKRLKR
jgi:hypothetical protein